MSTSEITPDPAELNRQAWSTAGDWAAGDRMNEIETLMWRSERHPEVSSTVAMVLLLDSTPDWDRLYAAHDWASRLIHRLRQRVLDPALPVGPAAWVSDPTFSLDYHVRRMRVPGAGDLRALLDVTESIVLRPFDRTRPLWEGTLVEGLADGRAAYVLKLHHSLTDGLGGIQLLQLVTSRVAEHTPDKPTTAPVAGLRPDPVRLATDELYEQLRGVPRNAGRLLRAGWRALSSPGEAAADGLRFASSLRRTLSPPAPQSPLFGNRTGRVWRFGVLECPQSSLRAAGRAAGGSINDAYVAALLGGLRRYHEHFGVDLDELPMAMPVSLRKANDPMGGNKFAGAFFAGPIGVTDPAERIAAIRGAVLSVRVEPALDTLSLIAPVLNRAPTAASGLLYGQMRTLADLSASNVPGSPSRSYLAGAEIVRMFPFGPLPGVAVMAAMVSYDGTCCIGVNCDGTAIEKPELLMSCLDEGLDEVLALATEESP